MENYTLMQYFHWYLPADGLHWNRLKTEAPRLKAMGIDSVWLPPAHKGMSGSTSTGYDSYDLYDLGEFDQKGGIPTKYGTRDQLLEAVGSARSNGLHVYMDIVVNHLGGSEQTERVLARKVAPLDRNRFISEEFLIDAFTKFSYPARKGKYSPFEWNFQCFSGVDFDNLSKQAGAIYCIQNQYGQGWDDVPGTEFGNYDYLMLSNIDFRNPEVRAELSRWGSWLQRTLGFDGVRLDAVKHIPATFFNEWLDGLTAGQADLFAVGEYWAPTDLPAMLAYLERTGSRMSLFDACLQENFARASNSGNGFDLTRILEGTLVACRPELAVTLVENHDTQPLQALERPVAHWFRPLAYALILLRSQGYPCVFYPDIYGAAYTDIGKDGQFYDIELSPVDQLEALLELRKCYAYGQQNDYFDHPNCIGWVRQGVPEWQESGMAVVMSNGEMGRKRMEVGILFARHLFSDALSGRATTVMVDANGWAEFSCPAMGVAVCTIHRNL